MPRQRFATPWDARDACYGDLETLAGEDAEWEAAIADTHHRRPGERNRPITRTRPVAQPRQAAHDARELTPEDWGNLRHTENTHASGSAGW